MKKLLPYLLLNIIVSALTMFLVLVIWNKVHPLPVFNVSSDQNTSQIENSKKTPNVIPALDQPVIEIQAVIVPGSLASERVLIHSISAIEINLTGWTVVNGSGDKYTFPSLTLFPGGVIALYTRGGENTALELYWGLSEPAWKSGSMVTVTDSSGNIRAEYTIP